MLLQELYRGKIQPGEKRITEEQEKEMSRVCDYQDELLAKLDEKTARLCRKVWEEMNTLSAKECEREYIYGMRMGARLTMELLACEKQTE